MFFNLLVIGMEKHGVQIIIYDDNGELFFLILRRVEGWKGWEFPKALLGEGEDEEKAVASLISEQVGISKFKVIKKLNSTRAFQDGQDTHVFQFYLVNASMNIPVKNYASGNKHDNYLWAMLDSVQNKLTWDPEKTALDEALGEIKNIQE
jgi:8-oxo-dGTP pyrophosphatase MutT (NUDIX family)